MEKYIYLYKNKAEWQSLWIQSVNHFESTITMFFPTDLRVHK